MFQDNLTLIIYFAHFFLGFKLYVYMKKNIIQIAKGVIFHQMKGVISFNNLILDFKHVTIMKVVVKVTVQIDGSRRDANS